MGRKSKTTLSLVSNATVPSYQLRFEKEDRARLNKICRDKHFLESLENIASRFRSNLEVYLGRSGYKKRRRFLNVLKRRTELLLEALRQGPEGELHFISIEAALSRLRQLG